MKFAQLHVACPEPLLSLSFLFLFLFSMQFTIAASVGEVSSGTVQSSYRLCVWIVCGLCGCVCTTTAFWRAKKKKKLTILKVRRS